MRGAPFMALASTGGFSPTPGSSASLELTLYGPTGTALAMLRSNSQSNVLLPDTGTYVLRVSARNLGTTGSYNVNVECLIPAPSPPAVLLGCGALQSGTIDAAGQVDIYTFEGQAGRTISVALASTGGFSPTPGSSASLELTLFSPAGTALAVLRSNSQSNVLLPDSGTYVLRVNARNLGTTGSYNVNVECLIPAPSPPAVPLACGAPRSGTIEASGQVDLYTFDSAAGGGISLALASTEGFSPNPGSSGSVELTLVAPSGAAVRTIRSNSTVSLTLPETGTYVVRVSARNLATTGSYTRDTRMFMSDGSARRQQRRTGCVPQVRLALLGSEGTLHSFAPQREEIVDSKRVAVDGPILEGNGQMLVIARERDGENVAGVPVERWMPDPGDGIPQRHRSQVLVHDRHPAAVV